MIVNLLVIVVAGYLLGSFPTGVIAARLTRGIDLRNHGSGNTGATNSFRVLGWKIGIIVALVDIAKGYAAVAVISHLSLPSLRPLPDSLCFIAASLAAVLGHVKPVFAGFKGGKGFGTAAGAITAAFPLLAPFCLVIFLLTLVLTGYVAACAAVASFALPFLYLFAARFLSLPFDPVILAFFIFTFMLTVLGVRKKLMLYLRGEAELFEKVMIFKPRKADPSDSH
jgi:glycerol-3-phosphate acyltransferase PlsY